jgi:hypothetical protein
MIALATPAATPYLTREKVAASCVAKMPSRLPAAVSAVDVADLELDALG